MLASVMKAKNKIFNLQDSDNEKVENNSQDSSWVLKVKIKGSLFYKISSWINNWLCFIPFSSLCDPRIYQNKQNIHPYRSKW